jgi:hypothetical protein
MLFRVTYEKYGAEDNEPREAGYIGPFYKRSEEPQQMTLGAAVKLVGTLEDSGSWFTEVDPRQNFATGEWERRCLHPPRSITGASYGRLKRVLKHHCRLLGDE